MIKTLEWTDAGVSFIDQTKLPTQEIYVLCKTYQEVAEAIRGMIVRGAPAIGVAAAMGLAASLLRVAHLPRERFLQVLDASADELVRARPTAVNLAWAVQRMRAAAAGAAESTAAVFEALHAEAEAIRVEDETMCRAMGSKPRDR